MGSWQTRDVAYGYDLRGLQTRARFDDLLIGEGVTNARDGFGRLASSSTSMGGTTRTLTHAYDPIGNRTRITYPDGAMFDQSWDGLNRPVLLSGPVAGPLYFVNYTAHGAPGNPSRGNGNAAYFSYDGLQRLSAVLDDHAGSASDVTWYYGRNGAGELASLTRTNDAYAWTGHYAVNRAYATNGLNQYTNAGGPTFAYDPNGNLTSDGVHGFTYDIENRLVAASPNVTLSYDPLGRLHQVTGASGTTTFLYDGDALVAEYDAAGTITRRHVHSVGADVPVVSYTGADFSTPRYLFADHQGSIVALADGSGAVANINAYDEYGIPGATNSGRFQYTGQIWISELGMYHYKARVYSPTLGRFLQTDPIGYQDQYNLYAYVGNDPVNGTDPSGRSGTSANCEDKANCPSDPPGASTAPQNQQSTAQSQQRLNAVTVEGGPGRPPPWVVNWQLDHPSEGGGVVVQYIEMKGDVTIDYSEAWEIPAGETMTNDARNGDGQDDGFQAVSPNTSVAGTARFYEGQPLPRDFIPNNPNTLAGNVPSRPGPPGLPLDHATPPVVRTWPR